MDIHAALGQDAFELMLHARIVGAQHRRVAAKQVKFRLRGPAQCAETLLQIELRGKRKLDAARAGSHDANTRCAVECQDTFDETRPARNEVIDRFDGNDTAFGAQYVQTRCGPSIDRHEVVGEIRPILEAQSTVGEVDAGDFIVDETGTRESG